MLRKIAGIAIACALVATMLAGCGQSRGDNNGTGSKAGVTDSNNEGSKTAVADSNMVGNMYKTGLPIVKDKVTLKAVMSIQPQHGKLDDMVFFKSLEEKTNVHIEWNAIPGANYDDKKNLMLASADLPDIFYGNGALNDDDITKYSTQGIFVPMDELIENYAPNITALFAQKPDFKKTCQNVSDGKIYAVGRAVERGSFTAVDNMFIYKPWLDKLGLKVPETTEDFYNALKAFNTKDPNGNGKADEIPFSFFYTNPIYGFADLFGAFGRADYMKNLNNYGSHFIIDETGKLVYTADKTEYKSAIQYFNRMFNEGLFDKEGFTAKDPKGLIAKGNSEEVILGCFIGWDVASVVKPDRANDYVPVAPLKGPSGKQIWAYSGFQNHGYSSTGFTITKNNKYPEISIRWLDQHFEKQTSIEAFLGPVDVNLLKDSSGMLNYIQTPQGMSYTEFRMKNTPVHVPCAISIEDWDKTVKVMAEDVFKVNVINNYYKPYLVNSSPYVKFNEAETKVFNTIGKDIDEYVNQMAAKWMLDGGIDTDWDTYLNKLSQLKLDEYVKTYESAYTRWTSK